MNLFKKIYNSFDENKFNRKLKELKTSDLEFNQNSPLEVFVNSNVSYYEKNPSK